MHEKLVERCCFVFVLSDGRVQKRAFVRLRVTHTIHVCLLCQKRNMSELHRVRTDTKFSIICTQKFIQVLIAERFWKVRRLFA
jgi:hypothetical protein